MAVGGAFIGTGDLCILRTVSEDYTVEADHTCLQADGFVILDGIEIFIEDTGELYIL